ncbi:MAG: formylglycine-generating enzyme family protein [Verrucomicrobiota bacterium]
MMTKPSTIQREHFLVPDWATAFGEDDEGMFAEFELEGVTWVMRWIEPGSFTMGSPEDEDGRSSSEILTKPEGPQHTVRIRNGFWFGETAITQRQWSVVMGDNPSKFKGEDRPVERVSWEDLQGYISTLGLKLSEEGQQVPSLGLPTEAQWEFACRAGTTGPVNVEGAGLDELAWFDRTGEEGTADVGQKRPNGWGLYDMLGSVWEWCQDGPREYRSEAVADPAGPLQEGALRVLRGGGWSDSARACRSARRDADDPGNRYGDVGFRLLAGQPEEDPSGW